jgi:CelD/BcsL family acetyltransferase involved in cellulose biosynthesis
MALHRLDPVQKVNQAELIGDLGPGDDALADAWRRLAELRENPFLTPEWYRAWLQANPAEEPFAIAWRVDGEVRGVLPLVRVAGGPIRTLRFAGARRGDWFTPACRLEDEAAMAAACAELLKGERGGWRLQLDRIDCESAWPQALWGEGVARSVAPARSRRTDVLPYIAFGEDGYEGYLAERSRNFRSQLGRRRRKLEREHGLGFRATTEPGQLDADFDTFFQLHDERWSDRGGSSSDSEEVRAFQREFAGAALERGWLRLWIAEADGAPRAAWYGWRIGDRYCYSLSGLSKDYESFALGTVLLAHTIEQAAAEGAQIYDLMWGDEGYKQRFETDRRDTATWVLSRRGHPSRLLVGARTALERRARSLRGD